MWTHPSASAGGAASLAGGQIEFRDCVLRNVDVAVECHTAAALALRWTNTLLADTGAVVRLNQAPAVDQPVTLLLTAVTLRRTGPLLTCRYASLPPQPGSIQVRASLSVLRGRPDPAVALPGLPLAAAAAGTTPLVGAGSVAGRPDSRGCRACSARPPEPLDDASIAIEGLVRSDVEFAGVDAADPLASRVVRWQVPLRSPDPPGADPDLLPGAVSSAAGSELP